MLTSRCSNILHLFVTHPFPIQLTEYDLQTGDKQFWSGRAALSWYSPSSCDPACASLAYIRWDPYRGSWWSLKTTNFNLEKLVFKVL